MCAYRLKLENDPGWMGNPARGSGMGRPDTLPESVDSELVQTDAYAPLFHLTALKWCCGDDDDYDQRGAYWGRDNAGREHIYCAEDMEAGHEYARLFIRAVSRASAKAQILARYPRARFHYRVGEVVIPALFRVNNDDQQEEVYALFPSDPGTLDLASCSCYARLDGHISANLIGCLNMSRPATPAEYAAIQVELTRDYGCNLSVVEVGGDLLKLLALWQDKRRAGLKRAGYPV